MVSIYNICLDESKANTPKTMNYLQRLIKIRGLSIRDVAREIGYGYHSTQKVIKGATYTLADGSKALRSNREIEEAVSRLLGLTRDEAWGLDSNTVLPRLIRQEIKRQAGQREKDLRKKWLQNSTVTKKQKDGNA